MPSAVAPARTAPTALPDPFESLNDEQRRAVFHGRGADPPPPLLIIAGAGTGKTTTLASRVARLVLDGADPQRLLLLTFSRRAAQEMRSRVGRILHRALGLSASSPAPVLPWAGTFHGVAARLLRELAPRIGLPDDFTIADRGDSEDLIGWVRQELGFAQARRRFPQKSTCLAIHSRALNACEPPAQTLHERFPWCAAWHDELKSLFRAYAAEKQRQHVVDYDDLLLAWWQLLGDEALAREVGRRFDHVLVDEFQDTNRLQAAIVERLKPDGRGLCVVGDDAQSIYSFRAAEARNILDLPKRFDPPAEVLTLQRNYRSTEAILQACNAVIALAPERFAKNLWSGRGDGARPQIVHVDDELAQAAWVADEVLRQREGGVALKRQAVLFRTGHHAAALELELVRRDIPYRKFGGLKFLEAAHVKDLLALLRWAQNPRGRIAAFRVALLADGVGPATARRLVEAMERAADPRAVRRDFEAPPRARPAWGALRSAVEAIEAAPWPEAFDRALHWYAPQLQRLHDDAAVREQDLVQLRRLAARHASREDFLAELTLDPPEATSAEAEDPHLDDDWLVLSTIHSAKGREWSAVCVLNVVDGCIPSDMACGSAAEVEEERRLLYVAMTRAMHRLHLLVPQRFYPTQQVGLGDRHVYAGISRFVPPEVAHCFDVVVPAGEAVDAGSERVCGPVVDIAGALRSMWS